MNLEKVGKHVKESGSGKFVKLADGESASVSFVGEVYTRDLHWNDGQPEDCTGEGCELCAENVRKSSTYLVNCVDLGSKEVRVWDLSKALMGEVLEELNEADDPEVTLTIKRTGSGKGTRWRVRRSRKQLSADDLDVDLDDLEQLGGIPMEGKPDRTPESRKSKPAKASKGKGKKPKKSKKHTTKSADAPALDEDLPF